MNSNCIKNKEDNEKNKKEILNNLLKKLLEPKISRLEKIHKIEAKNIIELTNTSQNLILNLETTSNNVRKQIYVNRQKLINNTSRLPKKMKLPNKKENKNVKLQRVDSKSFDKTTIIKRERNKDKKSALDKNKINTNNKNYMKTERISNVNQCRTISPFITTRERNNLAKTPINKRFNQYRKTPIRKKKVDENNLIGKEKEKRKVNNKNENIDSNKKLNKVNTQIKKSPQVDTQKQNINVINKFESLDNFAESEILTNDELLNSKINLKENTNKDKNEDKSKDNKDDHFLSKLSNQLMVKGTIKIDDKLVKDSLLVSHDNKGENEISIDDLIKGPVYQEIIIDEKIFNDNKNINNDKKNDLNEQNKNNKKKELNSSLAIYNKLKRSKITFLEGEHDFDLIFKDENIGDLDINSNLNKNTETNLTEISEHISLEEKFETNLDLIIGYLDYKDIYNLMLANKECFKIIINAFISKTEISIDILQEEINKLKENNPDIIFDNITKKQFKLKDNSLRAISLLNSSSGNNILKINSKELNKKEIILIFSLYFISIGKKSQILISDDDKKISFIQNYFRKNITKDNLGNYIKKELDGKIFDDKEIYHLFKTSKKSLDIISPNYYQKINKDVAIFVFVIKDMLEQLGILHSIQDKPDIDYILLNAKLQAKKAILDELKQIEENIN